MTEQKTEFPTLQEDYVLSAQQIEGYQSDGHIKLERVATPEEIAPYRQEILKEVSLRQKDVKPLEERNIRGKAFLQTTGLWKENENIARFVLARRFAKIAAELMGVEGVRIYHDQALFKEPGGGHTPWHQDQIYWPLDTEHTITMWMPLIDTPAESGAMSFASGSHKLGDVNRIMISEESDEVIQQMIQKKGLPVQTYDALKAGDATFHAGWTFHSAPDNPSHQMREIMTVIYFADQTRIAEPDTEARKEGLRVCLAGSKAGEIATGPYNPLVYKRGS